MAFKAKKSGRCGQCNETFEAGEDILGIPGQSGKYRHVECEADLTDTDWDSQFADASTEPETVEEVVQNNDVSPKQRHDQNARYREFLHETMPHTEGPDVIWHATKWLGIHDVNRCFCPECDTYRANYGVQMAWS